MMEKAVSEVVGYIYVFSIIMAVTAIAYLQINNFVEQTQKSALHQGIEQSFKRLQYAIYDVAFGDAYSKRLNIEVGKGSISLRNVGYIRLFFNYTTTCFPPTTCPPPTCPPPFKPGYINMTTGEVSNSGIYSYPGCTYNITLNSIIYEQSNRIVALEAGGVFSRTQTSDTLLSDPKIMNVSIAANKRLLILTIPDMSPEYSHAGGKLEITIRKGGTNVSLIDTNKLSPAPNEFHIFILGTEFGNSWCRYFDKQNIKTSFFSKKWCAVSHIACTCGSNEVVHGYVRVQDIKEYLIVTPKISLSTY